ncbi:MAG: MarR family transcriptional regulator [Candidatus Aenigmarchaeota archaeon]|nr:MarR family transcriptional regulator [Candidatus Aenigmarchaeota archaeon]
MKLQVLMLSLIAVLLVLAIPAKAAEISRYEITFDIQPSGEVKEEIQIAFAQPVGESYFTYMFAGDISDLRISSWNQSLEYQIEKAGEQYTVRFLVPSGTMEIFISFVSKDLVFWKGNVMQFFTNFQPPAGLRNASILVKLPQGFSVYRDMCSPENHTKITDGTRISIIWSIENPGEDIPVSVKMQSPYQSADFLLLPAIVAVFAAGFVWLFFWNRKKSQQAFLRGFTEDERKVVEVMRQRKSCYQNRLVKELGFSKAKMSRIAQKLEKKGLIEREKAGKNKRIEWKG